MKFKEESFVNRSQLSEVLTNTAKKLESGSLIVDNQEVVIPAEDTLGLKLKYEYHDYGGEFGFKVYWGSDEPEESETFQIPE